MKTKMPISSICYNTSNFINKVLKQLLEVKTIDFYAYVVHKGEDDECGLKDHIHLYIEPSEKVDTSVFNEMLVEPVENNNPFRAMPFRNSKFEDWILYCLHEPTYCRAKGLLKKYRYKIDNFKTNDIDFLNFKFKSIDAIKITPYSIIEDSLKHGLRFEEMIATGRVPIQQLRNYEYAYQSLAYNQGIKDNQDNYIYLEEDETIDEIIERNKEEAECDYLSRQSEAYLCAMKKRAIAFKQAQRKWEEMVNAKHT